MKFEDIRDHKAWCCECGSVHYNLLQSKKIECAKCGERFGEWHQNMPLCMMIVGSDNGEGWHTKYSIAAPITVNDEGVMVIHVEEYS